MDPDLVEVEHAAPRDRTAVRGVRRRSVSHLGNPRLGFCFPWTWRSPELVLVESFRNIEKQEPKTRFRSHHRLVD